jgi:ATP-binding cassette subfamily F protein 3
MAADRAQSQKPAPLPETPKPEPTIPQNRAERAEEKRLAAEARKKAAPLKRKAEAAEQKLEKANQRISAIDEEMLQPDITPTRMTELMKDRATQTEIAETSELEWLDALEAYETAVGPSA